MEIQTGDVVQLKSGGPKMTVEDIGDYSPIGPQNGAKCVWFDGKKRLEDVFAITSLTKA